VRLCVCGYVLVFMFVCVCACMFMCMFISIVTEDLFWSCVYRFSTYEKANYCRHKRSYMFVKSPP